MVEYRDSNGNVLPMEDALGRTAFTVSWADAVIDCGRRGHKAEWWITRTVDGLTAARGEIYRGPDYAFFRSDSAHAYNTFDEAARVIIEPVGRTDQSQS